MTSVTSDDDGGEFYSLDQILEACAEEGVSIGGAMSEIHVPDSSQVLPTIIQSTLPVIQQTTDYEGNYIAPAAPETANFQKSQESTVESDLQPIPDDCGYNEYSPVAKKKKKQGSKLAANYMKRMHGKNYTGFDTTAGIRNQRKLTECTKVRDERKLGPPCGSVLCKKRKARHCGEFLPDDREKIFTAFWKMTWDEKCTFVTSLVDQREARHRGNTNTEDSHRTVSFLYYVKHRGVRKQVCRNMFLSTLGIGRSQVRGWLKNPVPLRTRKPPRMFKGGDSAYAQKSLEALPKLPSHYCRKDTSKLYLEPMITTKQQLFKLYKEKCSEPKTSKKPVSRWKFNEIFDRLNLSLHHRKKDYCDTCASHKVGQLEETIYLKHIEDKETARGEKINDKTMSLQGKCHVVAVDMQAALLAPVTHASSLYYKTKLIVHNYTIYDLGTKHAKCYLWDESEADLVASSFATCLVSYLENNFTDDLPIVIFSDGCTNQNRNAVLSNALLHHAKEKKRIILQKYLEKGHTQMEVDSVHANIETSLKGRFICSPLDYVQICKDARQNPSNYDVEYMSHDKFTNYSVPNLTSYTSIRPENKVGDPCDTDLKQIRYNPEGTIDYKLKHNGEWLALPRKLKNSLLQHSRSFTKTESKFPNGSSRT